MAQLSAAEAKRLLVAPPSGRDHHATCAAAPQSTDPGESDEDQRPQRPEGNRHRRQEGATTAHVRIDVNGAVVTASITNESVDELKLAKGMAVCAIVKSSDVMVGVE